VGQAGHAGWGASGSPAGPAADGAAPGNGTGQGSALTGESTPGGTPGSALTGDAAPGTMPASGPAQDAQPQTPAGEPAASADAAAGRPWLGRFGRMLAPLFPPSPAAPPGGSTVARLLANLAAIILGTLIMLVRQTGVPAWRTLWAEDRNVFLPQALSSSARSLFTPFAGYLELYPRFAADVIVRFPLRDAAIGFAVAGAFTASCLGVFVFHACSGHVHRTELRVLLAASVVLLPTALEEIANNAVNTTWYLLFAAFWALVWRPRSRWGMAAAALVSFAAASSNPLAVIYLPLAAARVIALPRLREHAATIGWLAGGLTQVPVVLTVSRGHVGTTLAKALEFYDQNVTLAAVAGHRGTDALRSAGWLGPGAIAATVLIAIAVVWACRQRDPAARALVIAAVALGLILTVGAVLISGQVAFRSARPDLYVRGSRYAQPAILLLVSAAIVAVDGFLRRTGIRLERAAHVTAAVLLVAVLGTTWVSDFRYVNSRATYKPWSYHLARIEHRCEHYPRRDVHVTVAGIPCSAALTSRR
jgi:hypothetical protein